MKMLLESVTTVRASVLLVCLCTGLIAQSGQEAGAAEPTLRAWVLTGPDRALRSTPPTGVKTAKIEAARNEWEFFQIAIRSTAVVPGITLAMSPLEGPDGARLEGHDHIRLYREHQLHIATPTVRTDSQPDWYPDALIPFVNPADGSPLPPARFGAIPFDLPADETHVFLVELYVPKGTKPGLYRGVATLENSAGIHVQTPVELTVWDFELPRLAALNTAFDSVAARIRLWQGDRFVFHRPSMDEPGMASAIALAAQLTTEHRLNTLLPIMEDPNWITDFIQADGSFQFSPAQLAQWKTFAAQYHVNALPVPRPSRFFSLEERDRIFNYLHSWDRAFEEAGLADLLCYTYIEDEPNTQEAYESVRQWGAVIAEANPRVKRLVVEQTKTQDAAWGDLYGAVDIWVPLFPLFNPESAAARQALGEEIWAYTALCQGRMTPRWHTDGPLLNYRAPALIAWRYGITGLLYWDISRWHNLKDPWTDPANHGEYNGEGSLLYPGGDVGFEGAVPSLRLKVLRSGIQDYDYLHILDELGLHEQAMKVIMRVGPSWFEWARDPQAYLAARRALARLIVSRQPVPEKLLPDALPPNETQAAVQELPQATVPLMERGAAPAIDGVLDKIYSEQGATLKMSEANDGGKPNAKTTVYVARDDQHLYVFFNCDETSMDQLRSNVKSRDGEVWTDDSVELFIDRAGDGRRYAQIVVNAVGTVYDGRHDLGAKWNAPVTVAAARQAQSWTAEICLPFKALDGSPKSSETWRMNFCRGRKPLEAGAIIEEYSAWSVTFGGFQNPERFGTILFK